MYVVKRDGRHERVLFDKVTARISRLCYGLDVNHVDPIEISQKVVLGIFPGVTTTQLDNLAAETAAYLTTKHPDYAILAARIAVSNLHKDTTKQFNAVVQSLYDYENPKLGNRHQPKVTKEFNEIVQKHADRLNSAIIYDRDYNYNYFGFKTLYRAYLMRIDDLVVERPQHMLMRVALAIHGDDIDAAIESYNFMSEKSFTHASPTLFHAGTPMQQLSSCFLLSMEGDSIDGIYDTLKSCALLSKHAGGIGLNVHCIRASGSYIAGTNGQSNGLVPMLRVFNNTARYVDQGGNKRPGAFAIYLEPWHADIFEFLDLRKNTGKEEVRARDLFYGLWIPDLFMERVEADGEWSLMCPNECPGLADCHGPAFKELYEGYEAAGKARRTIPAQKLWAAIIDAQIETGTPYMLYKDACNSKSNQQNLGTIKCSNLCTEIVEYSSPDEVAVCNLASIALATFVKDTASSSGNDGEIAANTTTASSVEKSTVINVNDKEGGKSTFFSNGKFYDFQALYTVTKAVTRNLNKIIDINYYPLPATTKSNLRHRPVGIGVQGLADTFQILKIDFDGPEARQLNRDIFETIYFAAMETSSEIAAIDGPYSTYEGSPVSRGILQPDMWGVKPGPRWDWSGLRARIAANGVRNSLLVAPMPTASTSQILGFNECFEPFTSNIYTRRVLAGEFQVVNQYLMKDLVERGLWTENVKNQMIADGGSIQNCPEIPKPLKDIYRTVWEISQRSILDMAADRGAFIDQSQSLNIHIAQPSYSKLTSMHFYGWKRGLKTGMYYLRTRPAANAIQFTVDQSRLAASVLGKDKNGDDGKAKDGEDEATSGDTSRAAGMVCAYGAGGPDCLSCGS